MMGAAGQPAPHIAGPRGRKGFTLIELLTVMVVLSILAAIAVPRLRGAIVKAQAADVVGDLNAVKVAILTYHSDHSDWPENSGRGQVPSGLVDYLPTGFSFVQEEFTLDYDNWTGTAGAAFNVGVTFVTRERELGLAVMDLLGSGVWSDGDTKFTWVVES